MTACVAGVAHIVRDTSYRSEAFSLIKKENKEKNVTSHLEQADPTRSKGFA